jgi:hypothetical protein
MKFINKTSGSARLATLLAGAALFGLMPQSVLAATASGTSINNMAKLSYSVGAVAQNEICSSPSGNSTGNGGTAGTTCTNGTNGAGNTSFVVDKKVDVLVAEVGGAVTSVSPGQTLAVTTFQVTNMGNDPQDFMLAGADVATGGAVTLGGVKTDTHDTTAASIQVFVDSNGNSVFDSGTDTATHIDALPAGTSVKVFVVSTIPAALVNGNVVLVSLTATARVDNAAATLGAALTNDSAAVDDPAVVQTVFADAQGSDDGAAPDAAFSARDGYVVSSALLSVSKVVKVVCDPTNGNSNPKNIPGAAVQYAITITNAATATSAATLTTVSDTLNGALAFDPKLNSGALPAANCVSGNAANTLSASGFGAVWGTGTTTTTYTAAGALAAQAVTAGVAVAGQDVTITFNALTGGTGLSGSGVFAGSLPPNSFITVYFNAFVQ